MDPETNPLRVAFMVILVLLLIALIAFARGPDHRRGDEVGALRVSAAVTLE